MVLPVSYTHLIDLQGVELKKYISKRLADLYVSSLYVRLANELKVLGRHEEGQATQKWVTEFMKANLCLLYTSMVKQFELEFKS